MVFLYIKKDYLKNFKDRPGFWNHTTRVFIGLTNPLCCQFLYILDTVLPFPVPVGLN